MLFSLVAVGENINVNIASSEKKKQQQQTNKRKRKKINHGCKNAVKVFLAFQIFCLIISVFQDNISPLHFKLLFFNLYI